MAIIDWEAARRRDGYESEPAGATPECDRNGSSPKALAAWNVIRDEEKRILLNNAWCSGCHDPSASFAHGDPLRADKFGIVIEGKCAKYGRTIARCSH
mgnify:CR=1 FL=1